MHYRFLLWSFAALYFPGMIAAEVTYKSSGIIPVSGSTMASLEKVMTDAGITSCQITSTARSTSAQAAEMLSYMERHGLEAAKKMYGVEGDRVLDIGSSLLAEKRPKADVLAAMEKKLIEVLPSARKANRLMHVDRSDFDVFDVSIVSIVPAAKARDFLRKAKASKEFERVLGPEEGEKDCYHFEKKK